MYRKSNLVMVGILAVSIVAACGMAVAVHVIDGDVEVVELDGAAKRERRRGMRGLSGMWGSGRRT